MKILTSLKSLRHADLDSVLPTYQEAMHAQGSRNRVSAAFMDLLRHRKTSVLPGK